MPRSYVPTLFALKLPEIVLAAGVRRRRRRADRRRRAQRCRRNRRAVLLLVALAAALPIAVTVAMRPAMYNGIRHFVFVLPPLAVLGGLAGAWLFDALRHRGASRGVSAAAVFVIGLALPIVEMVRLHPYEYTYFNRLAGGVARRARPLHARLLGARRSSRRRRACWRSSPSADANPPDRRWKLAVCGPHRSPQVELGPDFETTWDPKGADFAMMLGEFYCAKFDAPVLVEVARDGVVYARVYDIRGRSIDTLLTQPGLEAR